MPIARKETASPANPLAKAHLDKVSSDLVELQHDFYALVNKLKKLEWPAGLSQGIAYELREASDKLSDLYQIGVRPLHEKSEAVLKTFDTQVRMRKTQPRFFNVGDICAARRTRGPTARGTYWEVLVKNGDHPGYAAVYGVREEDAELV